MRYLFYILCFLFTITLYNCKHINFKKENETSLVEDELKNIDWSTVDIYPSFNSCYNVDDKEATKACFESTLTKHIATALKRHIINTNTTLSDTIIVNLTINKKGTLTHHYLIAKPTTLQIIPDLKYYISSSLDSLPKIMPAIKHGQYVTTSFKLPIVIKGN